MATAVETLIKKWREDPGGTYRSWFLWEERLKNFRSIRRGIMQVVDEIDNGTFGVAYRGSSLETVLDSIAEQRQIFKGARCPRRVMPRGLDAVCANSLSQWRTEECEVMIFEPSGS